MGNVHVLKEQHGMDLHVHLQFKLAQVVNIGNLNGTNVCVRLEQIGMVSHVLR